MHSVLGPTSADNNGERLKVVGGLRKILSQNRPINNHRRKESCENKSVGNQLVLLKNGHGLKKHSMTVIKEGNTMEEGSPSTNTTTTTTSAVNNISSRLSPPPNSTDAKAKQENGEESMERLRREKNHAHIQAEKYKRRFALASCACLVSIGVLIVSIVWLLISHNKLPTFAELRSRVLSTHWENPRLCVTIFPEAIFREFDPSEVGPHLELTPLIQDGLLEEAASKAKVDDSVLPGHVSYSGYLTVNETFNSSLFFWYFPSPREKDEEGNVKRKPLILWLQGGPGWPTMYGVFKENGPYIVGYDEDENSTFLVKNKHSWTQDSHMLYVDNPVGAGFSFTDDEQGYPRDDEQVSEYLLDALSQFAEVFPHMTEGQKIEETDFFAFGESYGGSYVVSLARSFLLRKKRQDESVEKFSIKGIGIGNGFLSPTDQSIYAHVYPNLGYVTEEEEKKLKDYDRQTLEAHQEGRMVDAIYSSQASLHMFASSIMFLTNIYDFTFSDNYLTNHEYICYLQRASVRKGIHVGTKSFHRGYNSYVYLNESVMVSKKPWLNYVLEEGVEVLIYNGNLDVIVHVQGTTSVVRSLEWKGKEEFDKSKRQQFWVWNQEENRGQMAAYYNQGGGLTYMVVRNAGHMVPISQPFWARTIAREFTRYKAAPEGYNSTDKNTNMFDFDRDNSTDKENISEESKFNERYRWETPDKVSKSMRKHSALKDCQ